MKEYNEFLKSKETSHIDSGFEIEESELNNNLFDFQKYIVKKALKKGRYAIFAECGLGKTLMQLEWADKVFRHTSKPVLILAPLAVVGQTIQESKKFGIDADQIGNPDWDCMIWVSNYEQLENIDSSKYGGVVLDESSILKSFDGKTKKLLINKFKETPYKLCCTATPSPNDLNEIGNHSEFLNVLEVTFVT